MNTVLRLRVPGQARLFACHCAELGMSERGSVLAMADRLVRHDERAHGAHEGERCERRYGFGSRYEGEQHECSDRAPAEDAAGHAEEGCDMPDQVQGRPAAERNCGHRVQMLPGVADSRLEPESEEHDAGDHRQVEVAVGIQREPVQLEARCPHEPRPLQDRGHVEVEPPERRDDDDPERRRHDHSGVELEPRAEADGDEGLPERDQDDQPVPLGEVLGCDSPALSGADHDRAQVVDGKRDDPDCDAHVPLDEAGDHEQ